MRYFVLAFFIAGSAAAQTPLRTTLPQDHPYQVQLRKYLATLTEQDYTHGVVGGVKLMPNDVDAETQYRHHVFTVFIQPLVGTKRGAPSINAPPKLFLLSEIERAEGVHVPPVWAEPLTTFVNWKHPGNGYYHNRALKLRAFATNCVQMIMLDDQLERNPELGGNRADLLGNWLIVLAQPYPGFKDVLPPEVQRAYEVGLRKMMQRVLDWGPQGEQPNMDLIAAVGLWYAGQALDSPKSAENYARRLFTDPRFAHPAGYFVDNHGIDLGYQGMSNFFATWAALATDWPFAKEAVSKAYRLRAHLALPEPDGVVVGPNHFNARLSSDVYRDQWEWGIARDTFASLVTDEAAHLVKMPGAEELKKAVDRRATMFNAQMAENGVNPKGGFLKNDELKSFPWKYRQWQSYNFPGTVNFGYEHYPAGALSRRLKLEAEKSSMLVSPFLRPENFVRSFADAFTVVKQPTYSAIVHSGPVGHLDPEAGHARLAGIYGFGGGQLSAFWTPEAGAVILGRRGGQTKDKTFDAVEEWQKWPIHAVTGSNPDGKIFSSARIVKPEVEQGDNLVKVWGLIPREAFGQGRALTGKIPYLRIFQIEPAQIRIGTKVTFTGQDKIAECYETIPVFLHDATRQPKAEPTKIEFQVKDRWLAATTELQDGVRAVKLTRFGGSVQIAFEAPQRVKLSPEVWQDGYLSRARCRNLMIDLLTPGVAVPRGEKTVAYTITASKGH